MKAITALVLTLGLVCGGAGAFADEMGKGDGMAKDAMAKPDAMAKDEMKK